MPPGAVAAAVVLGIALLSLVGTAVDGVAALTVLLVVLTAGLALSDLHGLSWAIPAFAGAAVIWSVTAAAGPLLLPATVLLVVSLTAAVGGMLVRLRRPDAPPSRSGTG